MSSSNSPQAVISTVSTPSIALGSSGIWRRHPLILLGSMLLATACLVAIFAPFLFTKDPNQISPANRLANPSSDFWLGTDVLGRDLYSRIIYGTRVSLMVGFGVAAVTAVLGILIGILSGFIAWLDPIVMRIMDGIMAIPGLLLAIALMALTGPSIQNVIIAIMIPEVPRIARLARGVVLSLRKQTYVEAAIASGSRLPKILMRHILPNALPPVLVSLSSVCAGAMVIEAALSFIGAGVPTTVPSWGNIMSEGKTLWQLKPQLVLLPALFLSIVVLGVNLLGDGLRDALDSRM